MAKELPERRIKIRIIEAPSLLFRKNGVTSATGVAEQAKRPRYLGINKL